MDLVLDIASWVFLVFGSAFMVIGGIGLVRLPDFYARIHAAGITDTLGAWLILIGLAFQAEHWMVAVKLLLVLWFFAMTSPLSSHALAKAAWFRGLRPHTEGEEES